MAVAYGLKSHWCGDTCVNWRRVAIRLTAPRQRLWKIIAQRAVLATGAIERPIVFGSNDRPGVMTASAVSTYINRFAAAPGRRAVVFTTTDSGWATVDDLKRAGIEIAAVVDSRQGDHPLAYQSRLAGLPVFLEATVTDALGKSVWTGVQKGPR